MIFLQFIETTSYCRSVLAFVMRTRIWDVCESWNVSSKEFWCVRAYVRACLCVSSVTLLSCCLFIIDAVLASSIFANYPSTHIQEAHTNRKSTKKQDFALAEKRQDKQHQTSKFGTLFFVSTSTSSYLPSYHCLLSSFPFLSLPSSFYLFYVPLITYAPNPFLPLLTPPPVHHSPYFFSLVTPLYISFFLPECSYLIFINNL